MGTTDRTDGDVDDRYTFRYAPTDADEPIATICRGVAWVTGRDVTALDPLAGVVDPDALVRQFGGGVPGPSPGEPTITFEYQGCLVTVEPATVAIEAKRTRGA